jgi:NADH:ubiquinone oxidoreductase subunit K
MVVAVVMLIAVAIVALGVAVVLKYYERRERQQEGQRQDAGL